MIDIPWHCYYSLQLSLDQQPSPQTQVTGQSQNNSWEYWEYLFIESARHLHIQLLPPASQQLHSSQMNPDKSSSVGDMSSRSGVRVQGWHRHHSKNVWDLAATDLHHKDGARACSLIPEM